MKKLFASNEVERSNSYEGTKNPNVNAEPVVEYLTRLAAYICQTPVAFINFVEGKQQIFNFSQYISSAEIEGDKQFSSYVSKQSNQFREENDRFDKGMGNCPLLAEDPKIKFYAGANLVTKEGQVLGTLCVIDYLPRTLSAKQQQALEELSRQIVTELELRASLANLKQVAVEQEKKQRKTRSHLLTLGAEVAASLSKGGTLPELLKISTETIAHYLESTNVGIWTFDKQAHLLKLGSFSGQDIYTANIPKRILCQEEEIEQIKNQLIPRGLGNSTLNIRFFNLIVENNLVGVMVLFGSQSFSEEEDILLGWVANNIGLTIERILARKSWQNRRETLLLNLTSQLRNSLDFNSILETAVKEVRSLLQIDCCHFFWCFSNLISTRITVTHESQDSNLPSSIGDFPVEKANLLVNRIRDLEILRIDDVAKEPSLDGEIREILTKLGITSQLLLPLKTHSGQFGAIVCSHRNGSRPWQESEIELLEAVRDRIAIAIDQAEFYAQTRATAMAAQHQAQQLSAALNRLQQTQAQLVQHEKMSSLGQLVAGVAHEINNPVNFITGNLVHAENYIQDLLELVNVYQQHYPNPLPEIQEKVEDMDLDFIAEDLPKLISSMKMGAERIRQIVLSLKNFSRHDRSEIKQVDIHEGIDSTLLILETRLKASGHNPGIEIIKQYGDLPLIGCYAGQLNQVFMNIISNAIDALENRLPPRAIQIYTQLVKGETAISHFRSSDRSRLSEWQKRETRDRVLIRISDNGSGMTEAVKARLFDPFFTTKPVGKGTGLGLSISYQIVVEKHGGMLECISELGKGSEFWIQIPIERG